MNVLKWILTLLLLTLVGCGGGTAASYPPLPTLAATLDLTAVGRTPLAISQPANAAAATNDPAEISTEVVIAPTTAPTATAEGGEWCGGRFLSVLFADAPVGERLAADESGHVYRFNGAQEQFVTLELTRSSGDIDPIVALCAPDGRLLALDDDSGGETNALLRAVRLPEDGEYTVRVSGSAQGGAYRLTLFVNSAPQIPTPTALPISPTPDKLSITPTLAQAVRNTPLELSIPVVSAIERPGDIFQHVLFAAAGEIISVGVRPQSGSSLLPLVEIFGPSGELVASGTWQDASSDGKALIPLLAISNTGAYIVIVSGDDGSTGAYTVSYGRGAGHEDVRRGRADADVDYPAALAERGLRDVWALDLNTGDTITAAVNTSSPVFTPVLEITADNAPDTLAIAAAAESPAGGREARINSFTAPVAGRYELRITAASAGSPGDYVLRWSRVVNAPTATTPPRRLALFSFKGTVLPQQYTVVPFQGLNGQRLEISVIGDDNLDTALTLLDAQGRLIAQDDDSGGNLNPRMTVRLLEDGGYYVLVSSYAAVSGTFTLLAEELIDAE